MKSGPTSSPGMRVLATTLLLCVGCGSGPGESSALSETFDAGPEEVFEDDAVSDLDVNEGAEEVFDEPDATGEDADDPTDDATDDASPQEDASDVEDIAPPPAQPSFEQLDMVLDTARGDRQAWGQVTWIWEHEGELNFEAHGYSDTATRNDFWPASTIKVYPVTAALMILKAQGFSLDAAASFYHAPEGQEGQWVLDTTMTFREMIFDTFTCSSNETYTLLLRFAGLDWLAQEFFTVEHGFSDTALMRGYVTGRPWAYVRAEPQRIVVEEDERSFERVHTWSGISYADLAGCTIYNSGGTGNCTSPADMSEHMRRVMFHERLDESQRYDVRVEDLDWVRYGDEVAPVMNNTAACGSAGWEGVSRVMPDADFYHKGGRVSDYRLDIQYVEEPNTGLRYITFLGTDTGANPPLATLSEAVARMAWTPTRYVHLDYLRDYVNPVTADLVVYNGDDAPGTLELWVKDFDEDPLTPEGWSPLPGTRVEAPPGISSHSLSSDCLDGDAQVHIRGRLTTSAPGFAESDLHYVIIDADQACP